MYLKKLALIIISIFPLLAFSEPSTLENTLSKNCLKYYHDKYETVSKTASNTKVFIYARDVSGKDLCYSHHGAGETKSLITEALDKCKNIHKSSACKVAAINGNWMVKENDFPQITQPDERKLSEADIQKLMNEAKVMLKGSCLPFFKKHLSHKGHKTFAYALDEKGHVACAENSGSVDAKYAQKQTINSCEKYKKSQGKKAPLSPCVLFSVNNTIVAKSSDFKKALKTINNKPIDIFELAKTGVPKELEKALSSGIDVNIQDKFGYTPLLRAVSVNRLDNVKFLVAKGADINIKENLGSDALNKAVYSRSNNIKMIKFLFEQGTDLNTKTKRPGNTPLHHASELGREDVLKWLLDKGADVNQKNNYTETPMHKAADQGHVNILRILLANGAKINEQTRRGITPLDSALFRKNKKAVSYLKSKGATENNPQHK